MEEEKSRGGCDGSRFATFWERCMSCLLKRLGSLPNIGGPSVLVVYRALLECFVVEAGLAKRVRNHRDQCGRVYDLRAI